MGVLKQDGPSAKNPQQQLAHSCPGKFHAGGFHAGNRSGNSRADKPPIATIGAPIGLPLRIGKQFCVFVVEGPLSRIKQLPLKSHTSDKIGVAEKK